jgi:hypothetical protein
MSVSSVSSNQSYSSYQYSDYEQTAANQAAAEDEVLDPSEHPIAIWEQDNFGLTSEAALVAEKGFEKTLEANSKNICNQNSHIMDCLDPESPENQ